MPIDAPKGFAGLDSEFGDLDDELAGSVIVVGPKGEESQQAATEPDESEESASSTDVPELHGASLDPAAEETYRRLTEQKYGMTPEELEQGMNSAVQGISNARQEIEAYAFMSAHPEFVGSEENAHHLMARLAMEGLPLNRNTLAYVYAQNKADGLHGAPQPETRRVPTVGLGARTGQAMDFSGDYSTPEFDAEAFKQLPPAARRDYANLVAYNEKNGLAIPSVRQFVQGHKKNRLD